VISDVNGIEFYHVCTTAENRICGLMVRVLTSRRVDHGFELPSVHTKDYDSPLVTQY